MIKFANASKETRDKLNINVVNMNDHIATEYDFYIGRPSVLSNPYSHLKDSKHAKFIVETRDEAISSYSSYFNDNMGFDDFKEAINDILEIYKKHNKVNLLCFCKPKSCHGDFIKYKIENIILGI